jgi:hypothetical protein
VTRAFALTSIAALIALTGCGGDDSGETTAPAVSIPSITSPIPATTTAPVTTGTTTPTGTTGRGNGNGGVGPPSRANPNKPDSATNDVPPPAGSPQEAFEKQCEQNPQACG